MFYTEDHFGARFPGFLLGPVGAPLRKRIYNMMDNLTIKDCGNIFFDLLIHARLNSNLLLSGIASL